MKTPSDEKLEKVKESLKSNIDNLIDVYKEEYNSNVYTDSYINNIFDCVRELKATLDKLNG